LSSEFLRLCRAREKQPVVSKEKGQSGEGTERGKLGPNKGRGTYKEHFCGRGRCSYRRRKGEGFCRGRHGNWQYAYVKKVKIQRRDLLLRRRFETKNPEEGPSNL